MYFAAKRSFISTLKNDFGYGFNVDFALHRVGRTLNWKYRSIIKSFDPYQRIHYHRNDNYDPKV